MSQSTSGLTQLWSVDRDAKRVALAMLVALILGGIVVALAAAGLKQACEGLLWAGACSAVGWFLGFLFGIPRSLSSDTARTSPPQSEMRQPGPAPASPNQEQPQERNSKTPEAKDAAKSTPSMSMTDVKATTDRSEADRTTLTIQGNLGAGSMSRATTSRGASTTVNTNLEQISDWLTKIIVGVTLVESKEVLLRLESGAQLIGESLGGDKPESFAYAILIYFSTSGLLGSYLLTRLFLQRAFSDADSRDE